MKNKAPLVMMEQMVMVLIFVLAAALCLQTFVLAGTISKTTEAQSNAMLVAQNAAEGLKAAGLKSFVKEAEQKKDGFRFFFDGTWKEVSGAEEAEYFLDVCPVNSDSEYIWKAEILVKEQDGTELFGIVTAGQTGGIFYE